MLRTLARSLTATALSLTLLLPPRAEAFCGFYVAQADAKLFNEASKVVLARNDNETAITMASDYQGDPKEFALVIPVPTFVTKDQIHVVPTAMVDHLDAFTAPRLVDLPDPDPCAPVYPMAMAMMAPAGAVNMMARAGGVTVEARYEVGEYDIEILSATQSDGLVQYLTQNHYRIPDGAKPVLGSYIRQGMHFFIAKVNLDRMGMSGERFIRPLQVRYESPKFMLPIRLGTVNAKGPQDLILLALTSSGRVETSNYQTIRMPTAINLPPWVRPNFGSVYKAAFERQVGKADRRGVFLEYAWDMAWCDPCAAAPMTPEELATLGVGRAGPAGENPMPRAMGRLGGGTFVTRLHVRYDADHFPEDLQLQETKDRANFQTRYILRQPWHGNASCPAGKAYLDGEPGREAVEKTNLAELTGWYPGENRSLP